MRAGRPQRGAGTVHTIHEPQPRDVADLVERGGKLGLAIVAEPPLERVKHGIAGLPANADDERKPEFLPVVRIQSLEMPKLVVRQPVEAKTSLLRHRRRRHIAGTRSLAGKIRMARHECDLVLVADGCAPPASSHRGELATVANGRPAYASSATHGACSNSPSTDGRIRPFRLC